MIQLYTNDNDLFPSPPRTLTLSDLTPIPNVSKESAEIWLRMACKLMLQNPYATFTDEDIMVLVVQQWPKFYVDQLGKFVLLYRQVEGLKSVWFPKKEEVVEPKGDTDIKSSVKALKEQIRSLMDMVCELEERV